MYIYLIRHGLTSWNLEKRIQGREDIPLLPEGEEQAEASGLALKNAGVTRVYSSPLKRALKTAEMVAKHIGIGGVTVDEAFIERDFGVASGVRMEDIYGVTEDTEGLEPLDTVGKRMLDGIRLAAENADGNIAVVSHGGSINAVLREVSGGEIGSGKTRLKNACICVLEYKRDGFAVKDYNLTADEFLAPERR